MPLKNWINVVSSLVAPTLYLVGKGLVTLVVSLHHRLHHNKYFRARICNWFTASHGSVCLETGD